MIQTRERMYINTVKGLAIILMLWGHCIQVCTPENLSVYSNPVFQAVYSFHMPLFMLISGYLFYFSFEKRDLKPLLIHRTQGMLQPIVFASMLNVILMELPTLLLHGRADLFNGALINSLYLLWFLWTVLSSGTAVALAGKLAKNRITLAVYLVLGFFFVALFPQNEFHMYMYPYFVAGFLYGKNRERIPSRVKKAAWLSLIAFPVLVPEYHSYHLIYITPVCRPDMDLTKMVQINGFRWIIGFVGSLFVLTLTEILFRITVDRKRSAGVVNMVAKLGENSLAVYCISVSLLSYYLPKVYRRIVGMVPFPAENLQIMNYVTTPLLTVAYCFGLYFTVQFLKKIKIHRLIFGR